MKYFDWNKDAERDLCAFTNNWQKEVEIKMFSFKTNRKYLEFTELEGFRKYRVSIYLDEI